MKRQGFWFFTGLFGSGKTSTDQKTNTPKESPANSPMEVISTVASQPNVLQKRMHEKSLSHGETVLASLSPVRLEIGHKKMAMFFCPMKTLEITETLTPGDGEEIPPYVIVEGLKISSDFKSGMYALKNVKLTSNGSMQVTATENTTWELLVEQPTV